MKFCTSQGIILVKKGQYLSYEQGAENAIYFAEEVTPAIDRKKNIRVGIARRGGIPLSAAGAAFVAALRERVNMR